MSEQATLPLPKVSKPAPPVAMIPVVYRMPSTSVGASVLWFPHGETENGVAATVCEVGDRTVSLSIFLPNSRAVMYKDGVRHQSDPDAKREEFIESGVWEYSESTKEVMQLRAELERLRAAIK